MSRQISRKAWPLIIGGLVAATVLARISGEGRRRARQETENSYVV